MGEPIAEVGYEAGICGDDDGEWVRVAVDANGRLEIVLPIEEALGARVYNYDGATWRRSNLLFGYNAIWDEDLGGAATGADYLVTSDPVAANQLWTLQAVSIANNTRAMATIFIQIWRDSGAKVTLEYAAASGLYVPVSVVGEWVMGEGDYVRVYLTGSQAGDDIVGGLIGYKMKLNM